MAKPRVLLDLPRFAVDSIACSGGRKFAEECFLSPNKKRYIMTLPKLKKVITATLEQSSYRRRKVAGYLEWAFSTYAPFYNEYEDWMSDQMGKDFPSHCAVPSKWQLQKIAEFFTTPRYLDSFK